MRAAGCVKATVGGGTTNPPMVDAMRYCDQRVIDDQRAWVRRTLCAALIPALLAICLGPRVSHAQPGRDPLPPVEDWLVAGDSEVSSSGEDKELSSGVSAVADAATPPLVVEQPAPATATRPFQAAATCPSQHEVWRVSTRHLAPCSYPPALEVQQMVGGQWRTSSLEALLAPFNGQLMLFVHGNRMEAPELHMRGTMYFNCLTAGACPRIRFVAWSWPSDQIRGQVRDVRAKAGRADCEGIYLAYFLSQIPDGLPTSLLGYSYGCRVIAKALHVRACGGIPAMPLPPPARTFRVAFTAPAMSSHALLPGHEYSQALTQIDRLLILYNTKDPVLKRYRVVEQDGRIEALGYTGFHYRAPGGEKIRQFDAQGYIGRSHDETRYLSCEPIKAMLRSHVVMPAPGVWWRSVPESSVE